MALGLPSSMLMVAAGAISTSGMLILFLEMMFTEAKPSMGKPIAVENASSLGYPSSARDVPSSHTIWWYFFPSITVSLRLYSGKRNDSPSSSGLSLFSVIAAPKMRKGSDMIRVKKADFIGAPLSKSVFPKPDISAADQFLARH